MRNDDLGQILKARLALGDIEDDAALRHDDETIADLERMIEIVGDEDAGDALTAQLRDVLQTFPSRAPRARSSARRGGASCF